MTTSPAYVPHNHIAFLRMLPWQRTLWLDMLRQWRDDVRGGKIIPPARATEAEPLEARASLESHPTIQRSGDQ